MKPLAKVNNAKVKRQIKAAHSLQSSFTIPKQPIKLAEVGMNIFVKPSPN